MGKKVIVGVVSGVAVMAAAVVGVGIPAAIAAGEQQQLQALTAEITASKKALTGYEASGQVFEAVANPRYVEAVALFDAVEAHVGSAVDPVLDAETRELLNAALVKARKALGDSVVEPGGLTEELVTANVDGVSYLGMSANKVRDLLGVKTEPVGRVKSVTVAEAEKQAEALRGKLSDVEQVTVKAEETALKPVKAADKLAAGLVEASGRVSGFVEAVNAAAVKAGEVERQALVDAGKAWQDSKKKDLASQANLFAAYVTSANTVIAVHNAVLEAEAASSGNPTYTDASGRVVGVTGYDVSIGSWVAPAPTGWRGVPPATGVEGTSSGSYSYTTSVSTGVPAFHPNGVPYRTGNLAEDQRIHDFLNYKPQPRTCPVAGPGEFYSASWYTTGNGLTCHYVLKGSDVDW